MPTTQQKLDAVTGHHLQDATVTAGDEANEYTDQKLTLRFQGGYTIIVRLDACERGIHIEVV